MNIRLNSESLKYKSKLNEDRPTMNRWRTIVSAMIDDHAHILDKVYLPLPGASGEVVMVVNRSVIS